MWLDVARLLGGGGCLYFGADWLVGGAAGLARAFGVRPVVVGLTAVAFGTSAPELVVSLVAALEGPGTIALANVVGSNIANLGLILGLTALVAPPLVESTLIRREVPVMIAAAASVPLFLWNGTVERGEALILLVGAVVFSWFAVSSATQLPPQSAERKALREEVRDQAAAGSRPKLIALSLLGLSVLVLGGKLFVDGASGLAALLGVSDRVIGLTVVAVGTSLPELAASLVAALKGHSALAVGNVVGSNIYNVLLILGCAAFARPLGGDVHAMFADLAVMFLLTLMGAVFLRGSRNVSRVEGAALLASYVGFLIYLVRTR